MNKDFYNEIKYIKTEKEIIECIKNQKLINYEFISKIQDDLQRMKFIKNYIYFNKLDESEYLNIIKDLECLISTSIGDELLLYIIKTIEIFPKTSEIIVFKILNICQSFYNYKKVKYIIKDVLSNIDDKLKLKYENKDMHFTNILVNQNLFKNHVQCLNKEIWGSELIENLKEKNLDEIFLYFPNSINNLGYRNLNKLVKKMNKEKKERLKKFLINIDLNRTFEPLNSDVIIALRILLNVELSSDLVYHFNDDLRIEYFKRINNLKDFIFFIQLNQFIDNKGLRMEYIKTFEYQISKYKDEKINKLNNIVIGMCKSDVKIRRELGINMMSILLKYNFKINSSVMLSLTFDGYEEIRNIALNNLKDKYKIFSRRFLLKKLKSHEYSNIYSAIEIIKAKKDFEYYITIFKYHINYLNNKERLKMNAFYGFITLINDVNLVIDDEMEIIFQIVFDKMKLIFNNLQYDNIHQDYEEDKLYENILWRTLKEVSVYFCKNISNFDDMSRLVEIMFNINHLGIYSYLYELISHKFAVFTVSFDEIKMFIDKLFEKVDNSDFHLSRKGAGVSLLFLSLLNLKDHKQQIIDYIINVVTKKKSTVKSRVIHINILTKIVNDHKSTDVIKNNVNFLVKFAFSCTDKEWKIKNTGIMLFSALVLKIFGRNAWDRKNKKNIANKELRDIIYLNTINLDNKDKIYMILSFYDRLNMLEDREIAVIHKCVLLNGLIKSKAIKILNEKKNKELVNVLENLNIKEQVQINTVLCDEEKIKIYKDLNDEDLFIRQNACRLASKYGFNLVSCEYLKYLIIQDSVVSNYYENLKDRVLKPNIKIDSSLKCFDSENENIFYDYMFNKRIIDQKGRVN